MGGISGLANKFGVAAVMVRYGWDEETAAEMIEEHPAVVRFYEEICHTATSILDSAIDEELFPHGLGRIGWPSNHTHMEDT